MTQPQSPAVQRYLDVMDQNRFRLSIAFQAAVGSVEELYGTTAPLVQAVAAEANSQHLGLDDRLRTSRELAQWQHYERLHDAIGLQGAMILFNTLDHATKEYTLIQHRTTKMWLAAGPLWTPSGPVPNGAPAPNRPSVHLFELIRAIGNYFRHRDEWLTSTPSSLQKNTSITKMQQAGLNALSSDAWRSTIRVLPYATWLEFERDLVQAINAVP